MLTELCSDVSEAEMRVIYKSSLLLYFKTYRQIKYIVIASEVLGPVKSNLFFNVTFTF